MAGDSDSDGDKFCGDPFDDDEVDDDGEGEEFYVDDGEGEEFYVDDREGEALCDEPSDDDSEAEESCGDPCDDEDGDDGEGEESCGDPCEDDDDDEDEDEDEEFCDDDDDGVGEELRDDEEDGEGDGDEDSLDDPSDDDDEGEGEGEEFCGGGGEGFCVSGFSITDDSDLSDTLEDRSVSEAEEEAPGLDGGGEELMPSRFDLGPPRVIGAFRMLVGDDDTVSDSDSEDDDNDTDSAYSDEFHTLPASRAAVDGLLEASLSEEAASSGCAVCKDVFVSGQRVVWLPCKHYFHGDCIWPWLAIRSTCPVCRFQLPTDDAESRQRQARELTVLVPVANQGAPPQSEGGGRGEGDGVGATIDAGDATEYSADNGPEQSSP